jgi:hypothetical protein
MAVTFLVAVAVALRIAIGVVLMREYRRARKTGFIWLAVLLVSWPVVSG